MHGPQLKICCIASQAEAHLALDAGADALGLVSSMPSGPGILDEVVIATIARALPRGVETFLLTSRTAAWEIVVQHQRCATTTIQLCDEVKRDTYSRLREELEGVRLVQVIHMTSAGSIERGIELAPLVDALLLDSGRPDAATPELGGTGRTHDWKLSRQLVKAVETPVYLAGGLRPDNVADAVAAVRPYGVDVCSGVRSHDRLDPAKLHAFVAALRGAA